MLPNQTAVSDPSSRFDRYLELVFLSPSRISRSHPRRFTVKCLSSIPDDAERLLCQGIGFVDYQGLSQLHFSQRGFELWLNRLELGWDVRDVDSAGEFSASTLPKKLWAFVEPDGDVRDVIMSLIFCL
jgi:hypothetical protein